MNTADIITNVFKNVTYVEPPEVIISPDRLITGIITGMTIKQYPIGFTPVLESDAVNDTFGSTVADISGPRMVPIQLQEVLAKADMDRKAAASYRIDNLQAGDFEKYVDNYMESLTMAGIENKVEMMRRHGYSQDEAIEAIKKIRSENALKIAKKTAPYNNFEDAIKSIRRV